jgi:hypothetical protein
MGGVLLAACGSGTTPGGLGSGGQMAAGGHGGNAGPAPTLQLEIAGKMNNDLDLLFMIDNSSSMVTTQSKFVEEIPQFFSVLEMLPTGLPNLHVAVISSDMGAPGDSTAEAQCTTSGDNGQFQSLPQGTCTATTLASGATFLTDVDGQANFTDPIEQVVQCISQLGDRGCGFEHQLASITRALGADGSPPPASNAGFLRPNAFLGIVILTNEDDCSAPPNTTIYSLNGGNDSITNPDGPFANYRCNGGPRGAHLCKDPSTGQMLIPPLNPPSDATGNPPLLQLMDCQDNDKGSSALIPVSQFVQQIKQLKTAPDNQIAVVAITGPPDPYGVVWVAPPLTSAAGVLWPQVMHSCGPQGGYDVNPLETAAPTDGSFGDPGVRISQFIKSFSTSVIESICDANYRPAMTAMATKLGAMITQQSCAAAPNISDNVSAATVCTVTTHLTDSAGKVTDVPVPNCITSGNKAPCWALTYDPAACPAGGLSFKLMAPEAAQTAASVSSTLTCYACPVGSGTSDC